jgi:hypothetical protein
LKGAENMAKYNNKKITFDGITFDSRREAKRYKELQILETAGEIFNLRRQVKFVLIPAQYETTKRYGKNGIRLNDYKKCVERECSYIADFVYIDKNGAKIVEDSKGVRTKDYIIKRKLMLYRYNIRVIEV